MEVVQDHEHRQLGIDVQTVGHRAEQPRPVDLLSGGGLGGQVRAAFGHLRHQAGERAGGRLADGLDHLVLGADDELTEGAQHRLVGRASVLVRSAVQDARAVALDLPGEGGHQAGLADAGLPDHQRHALGGGRGRPTTPAAHGSPVPDRRRPSGWASAGSNRPAGVAPLDRTTGRPVDAGGSKSRCVDGHCVLEGAELLRRVEPQLLAQMRPVPVGAAQGVSLTAAAVHAQHERPPGPLPSRMLLGDGLGVAHRRFVAPQSQQGFDSGLAGLQAKLVEP